MRRLISALFAAVMTISATAAVLPKEVFENPIIAEAAETSGKCGDNLT